MRFLRTASTARLLAVITAVLVVACGGAAIAVAATSGGPVATPSSLPTAVHRALSAPRVAGVSADITFTDNLIDSSDFTGQSSDPLLQGASGRLWIGDGRLRIELQSGDGDAQIVVDHRAFWISDPTQNVVYEGTLPADAMGGRSSSPHSVPTIAQIRAAITRLMGAVDVSGAQPTDVGGQAAYRVTIAPKGGGGLVGSTQLAWDAARGVPLSLAVYARGDATPVLGLTATHISYGAVPASDFAVTPPAGAKVVALGTLSAPASQADHGHRPAVSGLGPVTAHVAFGLRAPATVAGMPRSSVRLLGDDAALIDYGHGLGGVAVIESRAHAGGSAGGSSSGASAGGVSLPTRTIGGATATVLSTPLGTVLQLTRDGVDYTVIGSVTGATAQSAARGLF